ncbi:ComEC/Rec2 family competence protein [Mucilaginibacter angelicae]|uniref:ComEC/Rec2 family competence protein n=1 Tax=Mucilaginibacter angelicae TaxID=869718 RepID=A0ABV6L6R4_9SPHI
MKNLVLVLLSVFFMIRGDGQEKKINEHLSAWQEGQMDIHFINTGRGNSSFLIFPDGTTMLIDAGDMNADEFESSNAPLKIPPALPDSSLRPGQWIAAYIKQVMPGGRQAGIDYALITHFHGDHYGNIENNSPIAANGAYRLSGLTDVGDIIPIKNMLDRGHTYPVDLLTYYRNNATFNNYLAFVKYQSSHNGMRYAALKAGSANQVVLLARPEFYPGFEVRNIKSNAEIWSGKGEGTNTCFTTGQLLENGKFNENPLSNALKISYGPFTYYAGGDNTGYEGSNYPGRRDVETPMAKVIGRVDALTLNHHGNRDATNNAFLKALAPKVAVEQSWCSDQPGQEVAFRLLEKTGREDNTDVFDTYMQPDTKTYLGFWIAKGFKSFEGHVLIRVLEGGKTYSVFILDDKSPVIKVKQVFGPYLTHQKT